MPEDNMNKEIPADATRPGKKRKANPKFSFYMRKRIVTVFLTVFSLVAIMLSMTYAWFMYPIKVRSAMVEVPVKLPPNLLIGTMDDDTVDFDSTLDLTTLAPLEPVCGNGVQFYMRKASPDYTGATWNKFLDSQTDGTDHSLSGVVYADDFKEVTGEALKSVVCTKNFQMSSVYPGNLYLSDESTFLPNHFLSETSLLVPGLSTGYSAGALRVAIFQMNAAGTFDLKCIWIPNAAYEFDSATSTFNENGEVEAEYKFYSGSASNPTVTTISTDPDVNDGYAVKDGVLYVWDLSKCNVPFGTYVGGNDCYFRLVIWIDGTDRECNNALTGGKADLKLGLHITNEEETE